ncbi:hypothetical protein D1007_30128 [Hordeum vulgare]|nr:hypothetical protein D1007_30128 [Hordeum vulgare]
MPPSSPIDHSDRVTELRWRNDVAILASNLPPICRNKKSEREEGDGLFCTGDEILVAKCKEICSWIPAVRSLGMHSLGLTLEVTRDELKRILHKGKGAVPIEILMWTMAKVME